MAIGAGGVPLLRSAVVGIEIVVEAVVVEVVIPEIEVLDVGVGVGVGVGALQRGDGFLGRHQLLRELLARLYDSPPDATLDELRRRFCADLRAQRFGSDREPEIRTLLAALVQARLAISNPGYGATAPPEGGPS